MISKNKNPRRKVQKPTFHLVMMILVIGGILVILIMGNLKLIKKRQELNQDFQSGQNKLESLEQQKENSEKMIKALKSKAYLEEIARERFDLQKPGEKVVAFPLKEAKGLASTTNQENSQTGKQNFWQRFLHFIFH